MKRETDYGQPIKAVYTPKDIEGLDYDRDLGDPGKYPYTRGYYPNGYRSRLWTQRMTAGLGSSVETNRVLKEYRDSASWRLYSIQNRIPKALPRPHH